MDKDEILTKSRGENKGTDERERDALTRAGRIAYSVGGLMCVVIIVLEAIFSDAVSTTPWTIYLSMSGTMLLVEYVKLRRTHELIFALLELALAAAFFVKFVIDLIGG